jgi:hypothetical protein
MIAGLSTTINRIGYIFVDIITIYLAVNLEEVQG